MLPKVSVKGFFGPHQYERVPPHVPGDEHRLPGLPVGLGHLRVVRRKGPGRPLAMDTQLPGLALHRVGLDLGDVVADIVNQFQPQVPGPHMKNLLKTLPHPVGDELPVGKGEVRGPGHGRQVPLAFRRGQGGAAELAVRQFDAVLGAGLEHHLDVVLAHLVPQPPGAGVDDGRHLIREKPQLRRQCRIVNLIDITHFDEVVARTQGAQLVLAPVQGEVRDQLGVGAGDGAPGLDVGQVRRPRRSLLSPPSGSRP